MVAEAPAHLSTKVLMVLEALPHLSHQGSDGVRGSCKSKPPRCWRLLLQKGRDRDGSFIVGYPNSTPGIGRDLDDSFTVGYRTWTLFLAQRFRTNRGQSYRWCSGLPQIRGTKVPMVLEASAHPSHQGADTARGSYTSEPPRCRQCGAPHMSETGTVILGQKIEQMPGVTNKGPRCAMFPEGGSTAKCLTNSLHQVSHLGTLGSGRAKERGGSDR
ncbi:hypothetical protein GOBAR_DD19270 [Gossypium barbadense]|nr:hypothetical protein GOBAR_DD19270 [Gossypium barbadense]